MNKAVHAIIITVGILFFTCTCDNRNSDESIKDYLPVYNCIEIQKDHKFKLITIMDTLIAINPDSPLMDKAEGLAAQVSKRYFSDLEIKIISVDSIANNKRLNIDLVEKKDAEASTVPSWYQYFQGTTGGTWTTQILLANFLQRQYKGDWVDQVKFYYQGKEFGEWDHISLGLHSRYNFNNHKYIESF